MEGLEHLESLEFLEGLVGGLFVAVIVLAIVMLVIAITIYVMVSKGLSKAASSAGISHTWMAWLPFTRDYLLGEVAFEKYTDNKKDYMKWVLLALSLIAFFLDNKTIVGASTLASYILMIWSSYEIFKKVKPESATACTVGSAFLGLLMLFFNRKAFENYRPEMKQSIPDAPVKNTDSAAGFCVNCGARLQTDAEFCSNCGNKINK